MVSVIIKDWVSDLENALSILILFDLSSFFFSMNPFILVQIFLLEGSNMILFVCLI